MVPWTKILLNQQKKISYQCQSSFTYTYTLWVDKQAKHGSGRQNQMTSNQDMMERSRTAFGNDHLRQKRGMNIYINKYISNQIDKYTIRQPPQLPNMLNLIQLFTTFDLLSSIKFIFALFVLLKCLEVLVTLVRNTTKVAQPQSHPIVPLVVSEHISPQRTQSEPQSASIEEQLLAKDGKIEINSIKNKNIHKNTNKENEKGLAHPQPEPVKKIYKTANPSTADENDQNQNSNINTDACRLKEDLPKPGSSIKTKKKINIKMSYPYRENFQELAVC